MTEEQARDLTRQLERHHIEHMEQLELLWQQGRLATDVLQVLVAAVKEKTG